VIRHAGAESFVGGDFYDAVPARDGWLVIVGDVTGRGAEAAALTAQARHTLRTAGTLLGDPIAANEQLNRALTEQRDLPICTVVLLTLREVDGAAVAEIVCAGHPPPLLVRGDAVHPVGAPGPMVGAWPDAEWHGTTVDLRAGDLLLLYTDGVLDAVGEGGRFGEDRLAETLRGVSDAAEAVARVEAALRRFERGEQADDTAVVAVQRSLAAGAAGQAPVHGTAARAGHAGHEAELLDVPDGADRGGGDRRPGAAGAPEQVPLTE
jgi:serine phosphatase RsbU (regulator of sigma subunit)